MTFAVLVVVVVVVLVVVAMVIVIMWVVVKIMNNKNRLFCHDSVSSPKKQCCG